MISYVVLLARWSYTCTLQKPNLSGSWFLLYISLFQLPSFLFLFPQTERNYLNFGMMLFLVSGVKNQWFFSFLATVHFGAPSWRLRKWWQWDIRGRRPINSVNLSMTRKFFPIVSVAQVIHKVIQIRIFWRVGQGLTGFKQSTCNRNTTVRSRLPKRNKTKRYSSSIKQM